MRMIIIVLSLILSTKYDRENQFLVNFQMPLPTNANENERN